MKNLTTLLLTLLVSGGLWADCTDLKCDEENDEFFGSIWITINTEIESIYFFDFDNPLEPKEEVISNFGLKTISWLNSLNPLEWYYLNRKTLIITSSVHEDWEWQCRKVDSHEPERLKRLEDIQQGNKI